MGSNKIVIKGAREHNLANVDLDLPRDELIVFTGLSGSGKSSLAFDTIYAEGHLDRSEDGQPQPSLNRGYGHRDPRLSAASLRQDRCAPLPQRRVGGGSADSTTDR